MSLDDPDGLRALFTEESFRRVRILPRTMLLRYPPLGEFLPQRLKSGSMREANQRVSAASAVRAC